MPQRTRRRLTAWLGLVAMWLVVLAPLVSQLVVAARSDDPATVALCSGTQSAGTAAHDLHHADPLAACAYCDLLADHPAAPAVPSAVLCFVVLIVLALVPTLSTRFAPLGAFRSGRPRGPPAFSSFAV